MRIFCFNHFNDLVKCLLYLPFKWGTSRVITPYCMALKWPRAWQLHWFLQYKTDDSGTPVPSSFKSYLPDNVLVALDNDQ